MRKYIAFAVSLFVAGCSSEPVMVVFKPGVSLDQSVAATDECRIASFREIPQAMATQVSGGYYNPGTVQCNTIGKSTFCNRVGAVNIPASSSTYDANGALRDRYITRCLQAKGFTVKQSRPCAGGAETDKALRDRQNGVMPSCAVRI